MAAPKIGPVPDATTDWIRRLVPSTERKSLNPGMKDFLLRDEWVRSKDVPFKALVA